VRAPYCVGPVVPHARVQRAEDSVAPGRAPEEPSDAPSDCSWTENPAPYVGSTTAQSRRTALLIDAAHLCGMGGARAGFQNATRKLQKKKPKTARAASEDDDDDDGSEEEAEGVAAEGDEEAGGADEGAGGGRQRIGKRAAKRMRKEVEQHIEEYYKLDYEDLVGGQPCRFRYKSVLPKKYGLKTEQVLAMSDKELNQVSIHRPSASTCTMWVCALLLPA
jgi:hypothetical protein